MNRTLSLIGAFSMHGLLLLFRARRRRAEKRSEVERYLSGLWRYHLGATFERKAARGEIISESDRAGQLHTSKNRKNQRKAEHQPIEAVLTFDSDRR